MDLEIYLTDLVTHLKSQFSDRLLYVGLQGSYARGEATKTSDIDIMTVIDDLSIADLTLYRSVVKSMDHAEKSCGFLCSGEDLRNWNPLEICNLLHTTVDLYGQLHTLVPAYTNEDVCNFVQLSINNLYHELCHRFIHRDITANEAHIAGTYKSVFYILQNLHYLRHGVFITTKAELLLHLDGIDLDVLTRSIALNSGIAKSFEESFALLFRWCQETLKTL